MHDVIVVSGQLEGQDPKLLIFDRTAEGNTKPKAVIGGPRSGLSNVSAVAVYPPTGKILVNVRGARGGSAAAGPHTGIWNIDDHGDVPLQWTVGQGMIQTIKGVTVDPMNETIMISDKALNAVLTYALPEMFEQRAGPSAAQVSSVK